MGWGNEFPIENVVILHMLPINEDGSAKYHLTEDAFFSWQNVEEMVELAGPVETSYEYGKYAREHFVK